MHADEALALAELALSLPVDDPSREDWSLRALQAVRLARAASENTRKLRERLLAERNPQNRAAHPLAVDVPETLWVAEGRDGYRVAVRGEWGGRCSPLADGGLDDICGGCGSTRTGAARLRALGFECPAVLQEQARHLQEDVRRLRLVLQDLGGTDLRVRIAKLRKDVKRRQQAIEKWKARCGAQP